MAAKDPVTTYVPPEFRNRLRESGSWSISAILTYAMRHVEYNTWAEVLFAAETQDDCPRENADVVGRLLDGELAFACGGDGVDPDGIHGAARVTGVRIVDASWYSRDRDTRVLTDVQRVLRSGRLVRRVIQKGRVPTVDIDRWLEASVIVPEDRPVIRAVIMAGKPSPANCTVDRNAIARKLVDIGVDGDAWRLSDLAFAVKRPLAVLRDKLDAPRRAEASALMRQARAEQAAQTAPPSPVVVREDPVPVEASAPPVLAPVATPEPEPAVAPVPVAKKRGYVRKARDLTPRTTPTVIKRPVRRDVEVYGLMLLVLDVLGEMFEEDMPFIPAVVMGKVAQAVFGGYQDPGVGISMVQRRGYVTNLAPHNALAVWRVEHVEFGGVTVPENAAFSREDALEIVRTAFLIDIDNDRELAAFERAIASVSDGRYTAYRY